MRIGEYFKKKRIEKGMNIEQLAKFIRNDFQESLLWDFEYSDDNDLDGWPIMEFKRYCLALGMDPTEFADIPISDIADLPLPMLIKTRREEKGFSIKDLSERIGYYPDIVEAIETDKTDVPVCLDVLKELAKELDLPFRILLGKI